ncbi:MAG TPA: helix-turn-helix transcriptional regulator [Baekduia sp.]
MPEAYDPLAGLDEEARRLAFAAAVVGDPFDPGLAAVAAELDAAEAERAIDALERHGVVRASRPRQLTFADARARRAVLEACPAGLRRGAHRRLADALAAAGAPATRRARHVAEIAAPGDAAAVAVLGEAGRQALLRTPAVAAHWLATAIEVAGDAPATDSLRVDLVHALLLAGEVDRCREAAAAALRVLPRGAARPRARVVAWAAHADRLSGRHADGAARIRREIAEVGGRDGAPLHAALAIHGSWTGDAALSLAAATATLRAEPQPIEAVIAHATLALSHGTDGDLIAAERARDSAVHGLARVTDAELAGQTEAAQLVGMASMCALGEFHAGIAPFRRGVEAARASRQDGLAVLLLALGATCELFGGSVAAAMRHTEAAVEVAASAGHPSLGRLAACTSALPLLYAGDARAARAAIDEVADGETIDDLATTIWAITAAMVLPRTGDAASGLAIGLRELRETGAHLHPCNRVLLLAALVQAAHAVGDVGARDGALSRLRVDPLARRPFGAALLGIGEATIALDGGAPEGALVAAEGAAAAAGRDLPLARGEAQLLAARALAALDREGEAIALYEQIAVTARRSGATAQAREAVQRRGVLGTASALTARQREIAGLVAGGRTNREIAQRLGISHHTVDSHVRAIYRQLGVTRRAAVAGAMAGA